MEGRAPEERGWVAEGTGWAAGVMGWEVAVRGWVVVVRAKEAAGLDWEEEARGWVAAGVMGTEVAEMARAGTGAWGLAVAGVALGVAISGR